jgi:hypothetical protein
MFFTKFKTNLPLVFRKVKTKLPMIFRKVKAELPVLFKKVCFFFYIETRPIMLWENLLENGNTFFNSLVDASDFTYSFFIFYMRITDPTLALQMRIIHRASGLINSISLGNYNTSKKNLQILFFTGFQMISSSEIKGQLKTEIFCQYLDRKMGGGLKFSSDSKMFDGIKSFPEMQVTDFIKYNIKYIYKNPQILPFETFCALDFERENINNFSNIQLDQEETDILKFFGLKRKITIKAKKPLSLIDPVKKKILVRCEKISKNLTASSEQISKKNLEKWAQEQETKITQKNMIPNTANQIVKDNSNLEKVSEVKVVIGPKIVNSFMIRRSYIEYYIMREKNSIKKAVISDEKLSAGVFLDLVRYKAKLEQQKNIQIHVHRIKVLRKISRRLKVRDTYRRGRYIK